MTIKRIDSTSRAEVTAFFKAQWGSAQMVVSTGVYECDQLEGFIYEENQKILGLLTYVIREASIEIISLDSFVEGKGIGSQLMKTVEEFAKQKGFNKITLITTNDNLHALKFYQKRGYRIENVVKDAVVKAREIKPSIPFIGNDGIPLHDELELIKQIVK